VRTITKEFYTPFLACNLRVRGKIYWQFFISELTRRITPGCVDFVNNVSGLLLESLMAGQQPGTADEKYYSNFFRDVLSGKLTDRQAIAEQLEPLHWPLEGLYCLVELRSDSDVDFDDMVVSRMGRNLVCRSVNFENRYLMVFALNNRAMYDEAEKQLENLLVSTGASGAISDPFYGFENLSDHAVQTALALPFAGTHGILVRFSSYAVHQLLAGCDVAHKRAACCHILLWLKQLDTQKSFDYYRTLYVYLRHDRNLVQTAAALSIHRNTLVYRLEKLRQLLPLDLEDPDCRFRLLLSYAILEDSTL